MDQKEYDVHEALGTHVKRTGKYVKNHVARCTCGMVWYGEYSSEDFHGLIDNGEAFRVPKQVIHESEEWVWLGGALKNINSNFPHLFQNGRKLWTYCQGRFAPLVCWNGIQYYGDKPKTRKNSTVWKIAARRYVPLSIVLENTHEEIRGWVKQNYRRWVQECKERSYKAKTKEVSV
jgi:hypothetical protein